MRQLTSRFTPDFAAWAADRNHWLEMLHPAQRVRMAIGVVLMLVLGLSFLTSAGALLNDPDTLWHITVGKDIWQTKSFPHVDAYSHSFEGSPWIAKEWLSQIILYSAFAAGDWNGVALFTTAILLVVMWQLYWPLSSRLKPILAAGVAVTAFFLCSDVFMARPHIVTLPVILFFVHRVWTAARKKQAPSFWLLAVMALWANLHGSFTFGFIAAFLAFVFYLMETRDLKSMRTFSWVVFLGGLPLASMIHPYGFESIWSTVTIVESEALLYIGEWRAFSASEDIRAELALLALFGAALATRFKTNVATALFICLMIHMYLSHVRFNYLLFTLPPLLLADDIAQQFRSLSFKKWAGGVGNDSMEKGLSSAFIPIVVSCGLLMAAAAFIAQKTARWTPPGTSYPIVAIDAARAHGVSGNVLNDYNFGGALIFEGVPTFIDGRADRLFQNGFMPKIDKSRRTEGAEILSEQMTAHNIGWTLLPPEDGRVVHLDANPEWVRIYEDDFAVAHAPAGQ